MLKKILITCKWPPKRSLPELPNRVVARRVKFVPPSKSVRLSACPIDSHVSGCRRKRSAFPNANGGKYTLLTNRSGALINIQCTPEVKQKQKFLAVRSAVGRVADRAADRVADRAPAQSVADRAVDRAPAQSVADREADRAPAQSVADRAVDHGADRAPALVERMAVHRYMTCVLNLGVRASRFLHRVKYRGVANRFPDK